MQHRITIVMLTVLLSALINVSSAEGEEAKKLDVHFIDVGQGDSMLIQTPRNKNILIDAGRPEAGKKVTAFLKEHHVKQLDLVIATHPDIDHIGGLKTIMQAFDIAEVLDIGKIHSTKTYAEYAHQLIKRQIPVTIAEKNDLIKLDPNLKMRILNAYEGSESNNAASIVLRLSFKDIDFLLMSDVGKRQETELMQRYSLDSDIIKVAHHGSHTSTSQAFIEEVNPDKAILTYGISNEYGHPVDRVMMNLLEVQASMYPTAMFGDITISTDGHQSLLFQTKSPMNHLQSSG